MISRFSRPITASKIGLRQEGVVENSRPRKSSVYMLLLLLITVIATEGSVRLFAYFGGELGTRLARYDISSETMPIELHSELGFRQKPNRMFHYPNGTTAHSNVRGYRGPLVNDVKLPGTYRIVLLGGSTTHGYGVNDGETIDAHLRTLLSDRYPGIRFEVINLAYDGYDAYQLYLRMQSDGVRWNPDMVIVNSGINDVRNAHISDLRYPDSRTNRWLEVLRSLNEEEKRGESLYKVLKRHSYFVRLPAFFLLLAEERGTVKDQRALTTPNPQAIEHFDASIRDIARIAAEIHVPLILSTPASALEVLHKPTDTSTLSYWVVNAETTQQYRNALAGRLVKIVDELKDHGLPAAYVAHKLPSGMFLDDCHLTSEGNLAEATNLAQAAAPYIESVFHGKNLSEL
jgi:lysophospholipase L1-like esterase